MAELAAAGPGAPPPGGHPPRLVLASGSPRRRDLLHRLGLDPVLRPTDVDETPHRDEPPHLLASRLARDKALAAQTITAPASAGGSPASSSVDEVVLAADTVVVLADHAMGKPTDRSQAAAMLQALSGRTHTVLTAVAVHRGTDHHLAIATTEVTFRSLTAAEIAWYVATGEPDDKAGGYGLQGAGAALVASLHGSDTNVIGLPLATTVELLRRVGLDPLR